MWIIDDKNQLAMSCVPKNGSTSMRNAMPNDDIFANDKVLHIKTRIAWIREPIARLKSAYAFFFYLNEKEENGQRTPSKEQTSSWEKFVDHALLSDNKHWAPQKEMLSLNGEYLATVSHKFENIMQLWSNYLPGLLPWQNACTPLPTNDYRQDDIAEFYKEDSELWHGL